MRPGARLFYVRFSPNLLAEPYCARGFPPQNSQPIPLALRDLHRFPQKGRQKLLWISPTPEYSTETPFFAQARPGSFHGLFQSKRSTKPGFPQIHRPYFYYW